MIYCTGGRESVTRYSSKADRMIFCIGGQKGLTCYSTKWDKNDILHSVWRAVESEYEG